MVITSGVPLLKYRRTKIVATVGPASREPAVLEALIKSGVNVFRLNMSHGSHDAHREAYLTIRAAADACNAQVAVFADLCGPKIRTGVFPGGPITLTDGQMVCVTTRDVPGTPALIPSQYAALAQDVVPGDRILLDDGNLELRVEAIQDSEITCTVVHGGMLKNNKGMNLPGVNVSAPALTEKDQADARFAIALGVDLVALSFVRQAGDVEALRALMREGPRQVPIISKIEKPEALENIEDILRASDAIMIARGDLGVEIAAERVPFVQKDLIARCNHAGVPVITATQMLNSMIDNPRPTRAEASDVANAILDGTSAVMLSGETAAGKYPLEAVRTMARIAAISEEKLPYDDVLYRSQMSKAQTLAMAISQATVEVAYELDAKAIVTSTTSGSTARYVASYRPKTPVLAITPREEVQRQLALAWGIVPVVIPYCETTDQMLEHAERVAYELGLAGKGDTIVITAGIPAGARYQTNMLKVSVIA